jgi:large repetitive protein
MNVFCNLVVRLLSIIAAVLLIGLTATQAHAQLDIADGVVIKFDTAGELIVRTDVTTQGDLLLTSLKDDSAAALGQTLPSAGTPAAGDWKGVTLHERATLRTVKRRYNEEVRAFDLTRLQFAANALTIAANQPLRFTEFTNNQTALNLQGPALQGALAPQLSELSFSQNATALKSQNATPVLIRSQLLQSSAFAANNLAPAQVVNAESNWWGAANGPLDPLDNPGGSGGRVSTGVFYANFLNKPPLIHCKIIPEIDNQTSTTLTRDIFVRLRCTNATEVRIAESLNFTGIAFVPLAARLPFTLSPALGAKTLYAQFRDGQGQTRTANAYAFLGNGEAGSMNFVLNITPAGVLTSNQIITLDANITSSFPIVEAQFLIDGAVVSNDSEAPYQRTLDIAQLADGLHNYRVRASDNRGNVFNSEAVTFSIQRGPVDTTPPTISNLRFDGSALVNGRVITGPGVFAASLSDASSGLGSTELRVGAERYNIGNAAEVEELLLFDGQSISNGPLNITINAIDRAGNQSSVTRNVVLNLGVPPAPVITAPATGSTTARAQINVTGTAQPGNRIAIYLNNKPITQSPVQRSGNFSATIDLPAEGSFEISADASNAVATSIRSNRITVTYQIPPPSVIIGRPYLNEVVTETGLDFDASVVNLRPNTRMEFFVDGRSIGTVLQSPFKLNYLPGTDLDGVKTLRAVATTNGAVFEASRQFRLRRTPPTIVVPPPPYVGSGLAALPAISYGVDNTPIVITGRMRAQNSADGVPNASTRLTLKNGTFQRRINIVTDETGNFSYAFVPRANDAGPYQVTAAYPLNNEPFVNPTPTGVASFTIDRLIPQASLFRVRAPRGFAETIAFKVRASAGNGAQGVTLAALPTAQPSGALPAGISLVGGPAQDIPAGGEATFNLQLLSTAASPNSGPLIISVLSKSSGSVERARTRMNFELFPAEPNLRVEPATLFSGARRNELVNEVLKLSNLGLVAANNVQLQLVAAPSNALPNWVNLVSPALLPTIAAGSDSSVQLRIAPDANVSDGLYNLILRVSGKNQPARDVPVSIAVNASGAGSVRFKVENLFTGSLNNGVPVPGLAGARINLQNEANALQQVSGVTDANGVLTLGPVPPGRYSYRANAPNHEVATGRVQIRNGTTIDTLVFMEYRTVTFTWNVTPTTIRDNYNVNINATYQTLVPAAVLVMSPTVINIPEMVVGEVISGEITVTNRGLIRADNVTLGLPESNAYYRIEVQGSLPNELAAGQTVTLTYSITALAPLPNRSTDAARNELDAWIGNKAPNFNRQLLGCQMFSQEIRVEGGYVCINGVLVRTAASTRTVHTYGSNCTGGDPIPVLCCGGGSGGGSPGGENFGPRGGGGSQAPQCGPDCTEGCSCAGGGCKKPGDDDGSGGGDPNKNPTEGPGSGGMGSPPPPSCPAQ